MSKNLRYSDEQPDFESDKTPEEQGFFRTRFGWRKMVEVDPLTDGVRGNSKYNNTMPDELRAFFDVPYTKEIPVYEYKRTEEGKLYKNDDGEFEKELVGFRTVANPLPTFEGFARSIKVASKNVKAWCDIHPEFAEAFAEAKDMQFDMWQHNTNAGYYNTTFSIYYGKSVLKLYDRPDTTIVKSVNINTSSDDLENRPDEEIEELAKKFKIL